MRSENMVCAIHSLHLLVGTSLTVLAGDIVRIAPNELVFLTPQAAKGQICMVGLPVDFRRADFFAAAIKVPA